VSTFGERLRAVRTAAGLSQSALAGDGLSASYVSRLEAGQRTPSREIVHQLADKLGCSATELLDGEPSEREARIELELAFARLAVEHGESTQARERLQRLLTEAGIPARVRDEIQLQLSVACERSGDLPAAVKVLTPLFERACQEDAAHPTHLVVTVVGMRLVGCYIDSGDVNQAIVLGEQALECARAQNLSGTTQFYRLAATVMSAYMERGDWTHASLWAESLLSEATRQQTAIGQAAIYWNAAALAERQGNLSTALGMAERALAHLSEQENTRDYARIRLTLAGILLVADPPDVERAADLLGRCAGDLDDLGSPVDQSNWNIAMAQVYLYRGDLLEAEIRARRAVQLLSRSAPPAHRAVALMTVHDVLTARGSSAGDLLEQAFEELAVATPTRWTALDWRALAERLVDTDPPLAIRAFRMALDGAGVRDRTASLRRTVQLLRDRPPVPAAKQ
jgi:transcriptional regulator with XRE-family HTH domain